MPLHVQIVRPAHRRPVERHPPMQRQRNRRRPLPAVLLKSQRPQQLVELSQIADRRIHLQVRQRIAILHSQYARRLGRRPRRLQRRVPDVDRLMFALVARIRNPTHGNIVQRSLARHPGRLKDKLSIDRHRLPNIHWLSNPLHLHRPGHCRIEAQIAVAPGLRHLHNRAQRNPRHSRGQGHVRHIAQPVGKSQLACCAPASRQKPAHLRQQQLARRNVDTRCAVHIVQNHVLVHESRLMQLRIAHNQVAHPALRIDRRLCCSRLRIRPGPSPQPEPRLCLRTSHHHRAAVPAHRKIDRTARESLHVRQHRHLLQLQRPVHCALPLRLGKVRQRPRRVQHRHRPRIELQPLQQHCIASQLYSKVQSRLCLRLGLRPRPQIVHPQRNSIAVRRPQIAHLRVQVPRRHIERNRAIVHQRHAIHQLNLPRAQVQQRVRHWFLAHLGMFRRWRVRLAILVHHQVQLRPLHPQQLQPHMRPQPRTRRMREEARNPHPHLDLLGRNIRGLARPLRPMDHQPIHIDLQPPQAELDAAHLHPSAGRVLQHRHNLPPNKPLKVRRRRVPGNPAHQQNRQRQSASEAPRACPRHMPRNAPPPLHRQQFLAARLLSVRVWLLAIGLLLVGAHGRSSPGFTIFTLPSARSDVSQSSSSLSTCCCNNIS